VKRKTTLEYYVVIYGGVLLGKASMCVLYFASLWAWPPHKVKDGHTLSSSSHVARPSFRWRKTWRKVVETQQVPGLRPDE